MPTATMAEVREKKRKRHEEESSRSKKKATIQTPQQAQVIKVSSIETASSCPPVIGEASTCTYVVNTHG
jgi:hypothetical protein